MSVHKETLIFCDGDGFLGKACPLDCPWGEADGRSRTAASQRASYGVDGWRYIKGKDYCPACVKRLFTPAHSRSGRKDA